MMREVGNISLTMSLNMYNKKYEVVSFRAAHCSTFSGIVGVG